LASEYPVSNRFGGNRIDHFPSRFKTSSMVRSDTRDITRELEMKIDENKNS